MAGAMRERPPQGPRGPEDQGILETVKHLGIEWGLWDSALDSSPNHITHWLCDLESKAVPL